MKHVTKVGVTRMGLVLAVALLLTLVGQGAAAQLVGEQAGPLPGSESGMLAPSSTLISYQGTLTDSSGNPINATVSMEFAIYDALSIGNLKWGTETQTVQVTNGLFNVLLGSVMAIDPAKLTGDLWLDIKVNDEQLTPRERLAGVAYAMGGMGNRFTVNGHLFVTDQAGENFAGRIHIENATSGNRWMMSIRPFDNDNLYYDSWDAATSLWTHAMRLERGGNVQFAGGITSVGTLRTNSGAEIGGNLQVLGSDLFMTYSPRGDGGRALVHDSGDSLTVNYSGDFTGGVNLGSNLNMAGHSIANCGALIEANLQTVEELAAEHIDRFEEGDVLCWGVDRLEKCAAANDRLVQAVADGSGRPIVIGAEVIKVLGPVKRGDILVASDVPGYAMVNNDPVSGSVIAQALEDLDGNQGLIKAMVRKW